MYLVTNIISVVIVQFGGWFLQSVLIYFVLILLDQNINFKYVLNITGLSYLGFFISTSVLLFINLFYLDMNIPILEFKEVAMSNMLNPFIGKFGEYLTFTFISLFIYALSSPQISKLKAIVIAISPSFLILSIGQLFKYAI